MQEKEKETVKNVRSITNNVQKLGGEQTYNNFEEKLRNLKDQSKQRTAIISQLKYDKFVLNSKCDNKSRFQQSAQRKSFTLQKLKEKPQFMITLNSQDDQQQVMEDSKSQPADIQEKLKIAKESIKSKLDKFNLRKAVRKELRKTKATILRLIPENKNEQECGPYI